MRFGYRIFLMVAFALALTEAKAQSWELGAFGGGAGYMGDLNPVKPYKVTGMAFGAFVKKNFDGHFGLKLNLTHGRVRAADSLSGNEDQWVRNLSFFSPVTEIGLGLEFNFFNYVPSRSRKRYSPYLFAGGGLTLFNPKTKLRGETYELSALATEGGNLNNPYRKYTLSIPFGAGLKYNFLKTWSIGAEMGYRVMFSDYLDDVSGRYPDFSGLDRRVPENALRYELADRSWERGYSRRAPFTQRGDFRPRDTYFFGGITLTYTILSAKCPEVF